MPQERKSNFAAAVEASVAVIIILFLVKGVESFFRLPLSQHGIAPRTITGLPGILFSPFLHANLRHLAANAIPLFVLLALLLSHREYRPYLVLSLIWIVSGLGTWLIGRSHAVHIGASSIVFGLAAFLIVAGFRMKSWKPAAIAIFVFIFYGGIFYGALPQAGPISWEGHLCGAVAGVWMATSIR